jgi:succinate dehydrogenase/fumarate reductase cytochrome b subunit
MDGTAAAAASTSNTTSSATRSSASMSSPATAATATDGVTPWDTGTFVALLLATLFCVGVVGIVVGALNLKHSARRSQARTLIIVGVIVAALIIIFGIIGELSGTSSTAAPG